MLELISGFIPYLHYVFSALLILMLLVIISGVAELVDKLKRLKWELERLTNKVEGVSKGVEELKNELQWVPKDEDARREHIWNKVVAYQKRQYERLNPEIESDPSHTKSPSEKDETL